MKTGPIVRRERERESRVADGDVGCLVVMG